MSINRIQEIMDNWQNAPTVEIPRQQFSLRLSPALAAKVIALSEMYKRNRAEIMHDLLEHAVNEVSSNMRRDRLTKAQLWEEEWTSNSDPEECLPRDIFDEHYPGPDSTVYPVGQGFRFDRLWRHNLQKMAGQPVEEEEAAQ